MKTFESIYSDILREIVLTDFKSDNFDTFALQSKNPDPFMEETESEILLIYFLSDYEKFHCF
jgi:hypothetical protein